MPDLVEWDPYTFSILTEQGGTIRFKDIIDKVTVHEEVDEITGLSRLIIIDSPDEKKQPTIEIIEADGRTLHKYHMPSNAHLMVTQGDQVTAGDRVRAGEPLMDGPRNPHDILAVLGEKELQAYLVNEIQDVYRLQGVGINDKHINQRAGLHPRARSRLRARLGRRR